MLITIDPALTPGIITAIPVTKPFIMFINIVIISPYPNFTYSYKTYVPVNP